MRNVLYNYAVLAYMHINLYQRMQSTSVFATFEVCDLFLLVEKLAMKRQWTETQGESAIHVLYYYYNE